MLYYNSSRFPERIHPHLINKNLLPDQIAACRKQGIRTPIYTTVQWDDYTAKEHPEWIVVEENGAPLGTKPYEAGFYRFLCVNTPYRQLLKEMTVDHLEHIDGDGLFFDIVQPVDCSCPWCRADMIKLGIDPSVRYNRMEFAKRMMNEFMFDMSEFVRGIRKDQSLFYNNSHIGPMHAPVRDAFSHFELESLPSGGWGYGHFPIAVLYGRNLGLDCLGQTGKFHTEWGDFHSFKNREALEYEIYRMLAFNAKCMIGDQLEPGGKLSEPVYELVGSVYSQVRQKEAWCEDAVGLVDIGVFTTEEFTDSRNIPEEMFGVTRMLLEAGHQFNILDTRSELAAYKVLVLPDRIPVDAAFAAKLEDYVKGGGSVIASFESGLSPDRSSLAPFLGVTFKGIAPFSPDYLIPSGAIGEGLPLTEHVMYLGGLEVEAGADSEVLASVNVPYFNRTWEHFSSHKHTPSSGKLGYPGIVKRGNAIYFMHPIFRQYQESAPAWCKKLFLNALKLLLPEPLVRHDGPSTLLATLNNQKEHSRWVLHLLHYIPERRSGTIDTIEDIIPLHEINLSIQIAESPLKGVRLVPQGTELMFTEQDGRVDFKLPRLDGHQMIELAF
ncbi:unnamed protein product [Aphanomyces euteiches]